MLRRVGADRVIYPERDAGRRLAHTLSVPRVEDYLSLTPTGGVALFPAGANLMGRSFAEVQIAGSAQVGMVAIKRGGQLLFPPTPTVRIEPGDDLVLIGADAAIEAFIEAGLPPARP